MIASILITLAVFTYCMLIDSMPATVLTITQYAPYGIFSFGMFMALQFNRSRIFFVMLTLTIGYIAINSLWYSPNVNIAISFFIPLNILIFSFLKERGYLSLWGLLRFSFVIIEGCLLIWIYLGGGNEIITNLIRPIIPYNFNVNMHQYAIILFFFTGLVLLLKAILKRAFLEPFLLGVLALSFVALNSIENDILLQIFFSGGGIILISAIIQLTYNMSYLDELTNLPGRRALKEAMLKLSGGYVIAMVDIDFFKKFNDKHGHDVGDEVLRMVAANIKQVNGNGKAFRYGGEEFTILFPGKSIEEALPYLEEVRQVIEKRAFILRGKNRPKDKPKTVTKSNNPTKKLHVTISIGAAEKTNETKVPQDVMKNADKALYRAKMKGRNRVFPPIRSAVK